MTSPLRLHYAPDNASLCVRLALEELGLPYQTVLLDRRMRAQDSAAYRALNPNGLIPTLETTSGPIFETAAILLWLADQQGRMFPAPDASDRGAALKWLFWLSNTLHAAERMLFYPEQYTIPEHSAALRRHAQGKVAGYLDLLAASDADWLDQADPSILACYLGPMLRWPALYGGDTTWFDLQRWPRLLAFARRLESRPAAQRPALAEGLGPTPFSDPHPANPPEGSPL